MLSFLFWLFRDALFFFGTVTDRGNFPKPLSREKEQKYLLGKVNSMFGDVLFVSDNAGDYGEEEIKHRFKYHHPEVSLKDILNQKKKTSE